jgi:cell division protein FtsX
MTKQQKKSTVFSLAHGQSMFMTTIMSLLTFLSVLALGVALAIGTGVIRWNNQWDLFATIQVTDTTKYDTTKKIIDSNADKIESSTQVSTAEMQDLMSPWVSGSNNVLKNYLPKMWEIKFKSSDAMDKFSEQISSHARFLPHASALKSSTTAGIYMILMSGLILAMILGAIGICISYIAHNTAMLHRRELEILNQIGASDNFIAHQMQIIVTKISIIATSIGFLTACPILLLIIWAAHRARIGLMATINISCGGWITLALLPIAIIFFAIFVTRRTTINILENSQ